MKKLLACSMAIAMLATTTLPSSADNWGHRNQPVSGLQPATIINQTAPFQQRPVVISELILTIPGVGTSIHNKLDLGPNQYATFYDYNVQPCLVFVTIIDKFGPPSTAPNKFDVCTQNTIVVTELSPDHYLFTYSRR